jgi:hypothetical protein
MPSYRMSDAAPLYALVIVLGAVGAVLTVIGGAFWLIF